VIAHALIEIDPQYPTVGDDARRDLEAAKAQLEMEAPDRAAPDPFERQQTRGEPSSGDARESQLGARPSIGR
jgi:hypothetical protein